MMTNQLIPVFKFSKKKHIYNCNMLHLLCWMTGGFYKESQQREKQMTWLHVFSWVIVFLNSLWRMGMPTQLWKSLTVWLFDCCLTINPWFVTSDQIRGSISISFPKRSKADWELLLVGTEGVRLDHVRPWSTYNIFPRKKMRMLATKKGTILPVHH